MTNIKYCYIKKQFYKDNLGLEKILDINDSTKQKYQNSCVLKCENILVIIY